MRGEPLQVGVSRLSGDKRPGPVRVLQWDRVTDLDDGIAVIYVEATRRVQQDAVDRLGFLFDA